MTDLVGLFVPLAGMAMMFGIAYLITQIIIRRIDAKANPDATYRELAEEAVRNQKDMLEETRQLTTSLQEVERLLKEV